MSDLADHVKFLHRQYMKTDHTLKIVVMDAQFVTVEATWYLEANQIEMQQPSPYDYGQNGNGETIVKRIQNGVNKLLYCVGKEITDYKRLWGLAAMEVPRLHNSPKSKNLSCNHMWSEPAVNVERMPHVPFRSRVLG